MKSDLNNLPLEGQPHRPYMPNFVMKNLFYCHELSDSGNNEVLYDFKTVSPYNTSCDMKLIFDLSIVLHFANFSLFSSHTLLQTIIPIQRHRYRAFHTYIYAVAHCLK